MEKEYLIHNIDYKDNPEDQHQTLDITLSNLELAGQNITADVGIDTFVNGMPTRSNKYEDVSLTGAGGGGGAANVTFIAKVNDEVYNLDPLSQINVIVDMDKTTNYNLPVYSEWNSPVFPIQIPIGSGPITTIQFTSNNTIIWNDVDNSPIIVGDATFEPGDGITINGDCTITLNCIID